jgi:hypothetical protein
VSFVKSNTEAQETLLSWINLFNEGCLEMFQMARHLVEVLQAVNDNVLPNYL